MKPLHLSLLDIQQELRVPKDKKNNFADFKYRNLEAIEERVKPLLMRHELTLTFNDELVELAGSVYVKATAILSNGDHNVTAVAYAKEIPTTAGTKMSYPQLTGSSSTYARKYAVSGLFLIDDSADDPDSMKHDNSIKAAPKAPQATPEPKGDDELTRAKKAINEELERQGITAPAAKKSKLVSIISKSTIDTIDDANIVMDNLEGVQ